jgi:GntR family transcriptional regulator
MLIRIEAGSGVPITRQIVDQVRTLCASGGLGAGDRLPSVRELARQLAVNQNTILRAYERLMAEGVVEMRQGEGTFVTERGGGARGKEMRREREQLAEEAGRLVRRARALGLSDTEIQALVAEAMARDGTKATNMGGAS